MQRYAVRFAFFAFLAIPAVTLAQTPWRQVYKDSDVTVLFDTASVAQQSAGVWTAVTSWDYSRPRILENKKSYS
ncbi:MAG TPA: hypothetical protein VJ840_08485, partial [Gemmatimonadaceae bacterium]|nr:hypothetical protein [Gemmatimonadaceae bacterium]